MSEVVRKRAISAAGVEMTNVQKFARATFDSTAKYMLADDDVLLHFIKSTTKIHNIKSLEKLDLSLNIWKEYTEIRKVIQAHSTTSAAVSDAESLKVVDENGQTRADATTLYRGLCRYYGELMEKFWVKERSSLVDVLCCLSTGQYVLVEIQLNKTKYNFDKRCLSYAAKVFSDQSHMGMDWKDLADVYSICILGGGSTDIPMWASADHCFRHYRMIDYTSINRSGPLNTIPGIEILQYSLYDGDIATEFKDDKSVREWLDLFKSAHTLPDMPVGIDNQVAKAYERLRISRMESALLSEYNLEANIFKEYNENTKCVAAMAFSEGEAKGKAEGEAKGKAEGKAEANMVLARNLKDVTGMSMEDIYKVVDLTEEQKGELFPGNV